MRINYNDHNYIPTKLPCGKKVNLEWSPSKKMECCKTVCHNKTNTDIELCYRMGGRMIGSGFFK